MDKANKIDRDQLLAFCIKEIDQPQLAEWFHEKCNDLEVPRKFFINFGLVGRRIPRRPIQWKEELERQLRGINPPFDSASWTLDDLCRLTVMLSLDPSKNREVISTLLSAADMREQVVIYKSLPFLSNAEEFVWLAIDGIRTNMVDVFDAIALYNIYPYRYFSEDAWNQMVLKAIFMERPIYQIARIDDRKNQKLVDILYDFSHERWSASRSVTPELWRLVSGYLNDAIFDDLKNVINKDTPLAREAATKVIAESNDAEALQWIKEAGVSISKHSWDEIGKLIFEEK
ncbi:MAG: EboA domain-containing protein [Saprospiraceae bacterium]|nr:EboA domain-containing protein [Saprospiraceae bacterium]